MKRGLLWFLALLFVAAWPVTAQVIVDFEDGTTMGFADNGWGQAFSSVVWAADPSGASTGVLALNFDGSRGDKGDIQIDNVDPKGAHLLVYWIFLPENTPDSLLLKLWAQDNKSWSWNEQAYFVYQLAKNKWFPISFNMEANYVKDPTKFDHHTAKLGKAGVEVARWYEHDADVNWAGTILIDNVSLVGVEPKVFADFETGTNDFADNGWGQAFSSVSRVADPSARSAGVLALAFDGTRGDKGDIQKDNVDPVGASVLGYYIWLPENTPDSLVIKLWAQDNKHWSWTEQLYYVYQIPKGKWYPIYFDMDAKRAMDPTKFDHKTAKLGKTGIEVARWFEHDADANWSGTIYIDDAAMLGLEVGKKWVFADFEKQALGNQGFANNGWGAALRNVAWAPDPSGTTVGTMKTDWDFAQGAKGSFDNGNVNLGWTDTDTGATAITVDIWLPADIPHGAQVSIFGLDHATWTWTEDKFFISDSGLVPGKWNKMTYDVLHYVGTGELNPKVTITIGCQIYYAVANTWAGSVYWDNFTLVGVEEPAGAILSPDVASAVETFSKSGTTFDYVHLTWVDNTVGTESYNIYMSRSPINDLSAQGVIMIGDHVPHGEQYYNHRPYSLTSESQTFYYAVVAVRPDGTETDLTDGCKVGPITINTSPTAKAVYVQDFASKFVLDGLDTEFTDYKLYTLHPERCNGSDTTGWTPTSTDMSFNATFVIDDNYLYISADVTDDDLNASGNQPVVAGSQAWMGDALEFYIGYYNVNLLEDWHKYKDVGAAGTGDWRMAFTAWGTTEKDGFQPFTFPGVEQTVYQKFTGDGYIIEARLTLDSLALNNDLVVVDGAMLPLRIDGTDLDPSKGDEGRTLYTTWGNMWNQEDWKRPACWGFLQVVNGPVSVEQKPGEQPFEFRLSNNYPNPFNPSTTIEFSLANTTQASIVVYDLLGKEVRTLVNAKKSAGVYTVNWDGRDNSGRSVPSGVFFCRMVTPEYSRTMKMTLLK